MSTSSGAGGRDIHLDPVDAGQLGLGPVFLHTREAVVVAEASQGRIVLWNPAASHMFGYANEEGFGLLVEDLVPEALKDQHRTGLARYASAGNGVLIDTGMHVELPAVRKDGSELWVELSLTRMEPEGLSGRYAMAVVRDVTERREAERRLRESNAVLEGTQALAKVGSWESETTAGPARGVRWSREMYRIHGVDPDSFEMTKVSVDALIHPDDLETWQGRLGEAAASLSDLAGFTYRAVRPDGSVRWVWVEARFYPERPTVMVGFVQDVTDQKGAADELARLALVDELTGLRNRRGFLTVAEPMLNVAHREGRDVVLLYIDLDNLKEVNDRDGHAEGDRALVAAADLLRTTFRESDLVARLGGDEFCVLLHGDVDRPVQRLMESLEGRRDASPAIEFSVGVASSSGSEPTRIEDMLRRADAAMYDAKTAKGGHGPARPPERR